MTERFAGFESEKDFKAALSLSTGLAQSHGYELNLVTDQEGFDIINPLGIEWTKITIVNFEDYNLDPARFWNLSKFVAMLETDPPFVHIDHDVFLLKPLPFFHGFLFQSEESFEGMNKYKETLEVMNRDSVFKPFPNFLRQRIDYAYNCGVIGVKKKEDVEGWIKPVMKWITSKGFRYGVQRNGINPFYPIVVEQYTVAEYIWEYRRSVKLLLRNGKDIGEEAKRVGYVHLLSQSKRKAEIIKKVYQRLKKEFPEKYKKVVA